MTPSEQSHPMPATDSVLRPLRLTFERDAIALRFVGQGWLLGQFDLDTFSAQHVPIAAIAKAIVHTCNNAPSLAAEVARLRAALAYYADDANYDVVTRHYSASYDSEGYVMQEPAGSYEAIPVNEDGGAIARAALEAK